MYTGRPLPRPPKLMNFLISNSRKRNDGSAALDKSNEGRRKRLCRSESQQQQQQQQQQALDIGARAGTAGEIHLSDNDHEKARGFDLLNQAADWMSNLQYHPHHDENSSQQQQTGLWIEHSTTTTTSRKMMTSHSFYSDVVPPSYFSSSTTTSSSSSDRTWPQEPIYNQGIWNMDHLLPMRQGCTTLDTVYLLRMGQEVRSNSRMEKKK